MNSHSHIDEGDTSLIKSQMGDISAIHPLQHRSKTFVKLPSPEVCKEHLRLFDLGIKFELMHSELHHGLFWSSIVDLFLFLLAFSLFLTNVTTVWPIWLSAPHIVRGVLGLLICLKLPKNEDMLTETFTAVLGTS